MTGRVEGTGRSRRAGRLTPAAAATMIVVVAVAQWITIRPGHRWLDDFASYVAHAKNIAEGRPYVDTGYVYNPDDPVAGPRAYPPVYPELLAPVYRVAGLDLDAMKRQIVVLFALTLAGAFVLLRRWWGDGVALGAVAAWGASPFMWDFKDNVLSDVPFALFVMLSLLAAAHVDDAPDSVGRGAALGGAVLLAYGTRSIGIVLVPALVVAALIRRRRLGRGVVVATGMVATVAAVQAALLPGGSGYADQLRLASPRLAATNAWRYFRSLEGLTVNGYWSSVGIALLIVVTLLAAIGFATRATSSRMTAAEPFVLAYAVAISIWPSFQSLRFLIPLLPLFAAYAIAGARLAFRGRRAAMVVLTLMLFGSYAGVYSRLDVAPLPEGVGTRETMALFEFVRTRTPRDAVVVFDRPKALALYTGRRSTPYPPDTTASGLLTLIERTGATFVAEGPFDRDRLADHAAADETFELVFDNASHRVWRVGRR